MRLRASRPGLLQDQPWARQGGTEASCSETQGQQTRPSPRLTSHGQGRAQQELRALRLRAADQAFSKRSHRQGRAEQKLRALRLRAADQAFSKRSHRQGRTEQELRALRLRAADQAFSKIDEPRTRQGGTGASCSETQGQQTRPSPRPAMGKAGRNRSFSGALRLRASGPGLFQDESLAGSRKGRLS